MNLHDIRANFAKGKGISLSQAEVIEDKLYDWQTYAAAGQTQLAFFTEAKNSGTSIFDATQKKTWEDTNMKQAGILPRGEAFLVTHVCLRFVPGVLAVQEQVTNAVPAATTPAANDASAFWNQGWADFKLAEKSQVLLGPLANFPPMQRDQLYVGAAAWSAQAAAANATLYVEGTSLVPAGRLFALQEPGLTIEFGINFTFDLNWSKAVALPSGSDARVQAELVGVRMRAKQ